jgi:hypothetical protein
MFSRIEWWSVVGSTAPPRVAAWQADGDVIDHSLAALLILLLVLLINNEQLPQRQLQTQSARCFVNTQYPSVILHYAVLGSSAAASLTASEATSGPSAG